MVDIIVSDLQRSYGSYRALKGVSLDVRDQEFVVLLGPSGLRQDPRCCAPSPGSTMWIPAASGSASAT